MKSKKAITLNWELLMLILFLLSLPILINGIQSFMDLISNKPDQIILNQFDRLILTIETLEPGKQATFPNTIDLEIYSEIELFGKCKSKEAKNCRKNAAYICLNPTYQNKRSYCKPIADANFNYYKFGITRDIIIKKDKDILVTLTPLSRE